MPPAELSFGAKSTVAPGLNWLGGLIHSRPANEYRSPFSPLISPSAFSGSYAKTCPLTIISLCPVAFLLNLRVGASRADFSVLPAVQAFGVHVLKDWLAPKSVMGDPRCVQ